MKNHWLNPDITIYLAQADPSPLTSFLPIIFIIFIFYFLLIRPQSKKQKLIEKKRRLMEKGDKILTSGGIYGKVVSIDREQGVVTITIDGQVKMEISLNAITEVLVTEEAFKKREEKKK